jgi:hypothetical protein
VIHPRCVAWVLDFGCFAFIKWTHNCIQSAPFADELLVLGLTLVCVCAHSSVSEKGYSVRMADVGASTIAQNVGLSTIAQNVGVSTIERNVGVSTIALADSRHNST